MKKLALITIIYTSIFFTSIPIPAQEGDILYQKNQINNEIINELMSLEKQYDFLDLDFSNINQRKDLSENFNFDSIDELKQFLNDIQKELNNKPETEIIDIKVNPLVRHTEFYAFKKWSPFTPAGAVFYWKHTDFKYDYEVVNGKPQFTGYQYARAYNSGVTAFNYNQTSDMVRYTTSVSTKDTANITIYGYHLIGISIGGLQVGARIADTWDWSLRIY